MGRRRGGVGNVHHNTLKSIRAVVLGKDGVGKSALTVRFLTRRYIGEYDSTLEATYRHYLIIDGQSISLDVMDTAGKISTLCAVENLKGPLQKITANTLTEVVQWRKTFLINSMEKMQSCIAFAELFFVLYSTTDRTSFEEASLLTRYILRDKSLNSGATVNIVGTKSDLTHLREVEEQEGKLLATNLNCEFYQISNSEGYVETQELLFAALRRCLDRNKGSPFSRVKDGLVVTAKSFRKKSTGNETSAERDTLKSTRRKSVHHGISDGGEMPGPMRTKSFIFSEEEEHITESLREKSSSHEDLSKERRKYKNSVTSTASF